MSHKFVFMKYFKNMCVLVYNYTVYKNVEVEHPAKGLK